jgi:hypothetical protein
MQFSDTTNKLGLVQDIDFILFSDTTSTSPYAIADKTRNMNSWYDRAVSLILRADGRWEWDDNNKTDLPIATAALVANQQDYEMSGATFLKILKVEVKSQSGDWLPLDPISIADKKTESMTDYLKTAGTPQKYDKLGNSLFLYPKPSYGADASLKVYYQRNVDHFAAADTTDVPGFAEIFHRYLSFGAAFDYALANGMNGKVNTLSPIITRMESDIVDFYSDRGKDENVSITLQQENYGEELYGGYDDNTFHGVTYT